ncbi:unnamed protein product [Peniophora sp. CBMAI 1063]|nr:unnamed protein product [Peniophora sp. CBMAI 1063]
MTNWTSPHVLMAQGSALQNYTLVFLGLYMCVHPGTSLTVTLNWGSACGVISYEFASSLTFDWWLITKKRSQQSSPLARSVRWLYLACRLCALAASITLAAPYMHIEKSECTASVKMAAISGVFGVILATALLFIRVGVVWRWDKRISAAFVVVHAANVALGVYSTVHIKSSYVVTIDTPSLCAASGFKTANQSGIFAILVTDVGLLCLLLIGLRRWEHAKAMSLWHILWNQGFVYLALSVIVELPLLVFLFLELNDIIAVFFLIPQSLILPIAAARCYRSLTNMADSRKTYETVDFPSPPKPVVHLFPGRRRRAKDDSNGNIRDIELGPLSRAEG